MRCLTADAVKTGFWVCVQENCDGIHHYFQRTYNVTPDACVDAS